MCVTLSPAATHAAWLDTEVSALAADGPLLVAAIPDALQVFRREAGGLVALPGTRVAAPRFRALAALPNGVAGATDDGVFLLGADEPFPSLAAGLNSSRPWEPMVRVRAGDDELRGVVGLHAHAGAEAAAADEVSRGVCRGRGRGRQGQRSAGQHGRPASSAGRRRGRGKERRCS